MSNSWCSLFLLPTTWTLILTHLSGSVFRLPILGSTELRSVGSVFRFRRLRCQIFSLLFRARSVELPKLFRSIRHRNFPMQSMIDFFVAGSVVSKKSFRECFYAIRILMFALFVFNSIQTKRSTELAMAGARCPWRKLTSWKNSTVVSF